MHGFPDEAVTIRQIRINLAPQFELANRVTEYWLNLPFDELLAHCCQTETTVFVAMSLNTQASRQFRTTVELCERGEGADASVIARSLFETVVATAWALFPVVRLEPAQQRDKRTGAILTHPDGTTRYQVKVPKRDNRLATHRISRHLRSSILAHACEVQDHNFVRSRSQVNGRKRVAQVVGRNHTPASKSAVVSEIGAEWYSVLTQSPHTYSGLTLSQLAKVLGGRLDYWYELVYPFQSRDTHSVNVLQYANATGDGGSNRSWHSVSSYVSGVLSTAITTYLSHLDILQSNLRMGAKVQKAIQQFIKVQNTL